MGDVRISVSAFGLVAYDALTDKRLDLVKKFLAEERQVDGLESAFVVRMI